MAAEFTRCLVCGQKVKFLHPHHHESTHDAGLPQDHESYLNWVAEQWDLPEDHPVLESGELTKPEGWQRNRDLFSDWRSKIVQ